MNTSSQYLIKAYRCFVVLASLFLVGCMTSSSERLNYLSVGMTKAEVINAIGSPDSVSAKGGAEYLVYTLRTVTTLTRNTWEEEAPYFVRLINGRVESYGYVLDFDSTKDPTLNLNIINR